MILMVNIFMNIRSFISKFFQKKERDSLTPEEEFVGYEVFPSYYQPKTLCYYPAEGLIGKDNKKYSK